jgi:hypothetical protein
VFPPPVPQTRLSYDIIPNRFSKSNFLSEHDPEKWIPVFGKDHAPRRS